MKRIKLKNGTARVDDDCNEKTIEALNELSERAYNFNKGIYCGCENPEPFYQSPDKCCICYKTVTKEHFN